MPDIYIGIGSNLGNRDKNIHDSLNHLKKKVKIITVSSILESKPMYYLNQKNFLNCVAHIKSEKNPRELLQTLQQIEKKMKRKRIIKNGPRTIDLDILLYKNKIINEKDLIIPHPKFHEREFVLKPLIEINPNLIHPILKKSVKKLLKELTSC